MDNTDLMPRPDGDSAPEPASKRPPILSPDDFHELALDEPRELSTRTRIIAAVVAVVMALICAFPVAEWAASPTTHAGSIDKLDSKAETVTALVGSATAASVAITLLPDDVGTPIADKLVDIAADFAVVLGAIYLEKYLLTIMGLAAFRVIIPLACAIFFLAMVLRCSPQLKGKLYSATVRLLLLAVAAFALVPASVYISSLIEDTYHYDAAGVAQSLGTQAQQSQDENIGNATSDSGSSSSSTDSSTSNSNSSDASSSDGNWFNNFIDWAGNLGQTVADAASSAANGITSGVSSVLDSAKAWVSNLVEAFAVMIVTCCVIPILVLLFFVWLINLLLGLSIQVPTNPMGGVKGRLHRSGRTKKVAKA